MPAPQLLTFEFTVGDTLPQLLLQFADKATGNPTNITGYNVSLKIKRPSDVLTVAGTVYDPANGKAAFIWQGTEFVAGLNQPAEIVLLDAQGRRKTFQHLLFNVLADVGS